MYRRPILKFILFRRPVTVRVNRPCSRTSLISWHRCRVRDPHHFRPLRQGPVRRFALGVTGRFRGLGRAGVVPATSRSKCRGPVA